MCLGVPGQIIEVVDAEKFLATADMSDAKRTINIALVHADGVAPGDWVLVHAGFALNKMTAEEALEARRILKEMSDAYADELSAVMGGMMDNAGSISRVSAGGGEYDGGAGKHGPGHSQGVADDTELLVQAFALIQLPEAVGKDAAVADLARRQGST